LLPATRFAVEAYVHFVREKTLLEAIASSLTELFSPQIISERLAGMLKSYDFVSADTLAYFSARAPLAQRDSEFTLDYVKRHAKRKRRAEDASAPHRHDRAHPASPKADAIAAEIIKRCTGEVTFGEIRR
jgi:coenzyme PQQ biosynthesis protein C